MCLLLLGPGVTFQPQLPSSPQVALQSQLPAQGPLRGGLVASPGTHPLFLGLALLQRPACLPSAHTAGTLGPWPACSAGSTAWSPSWLAQNNQNKRKRWQ